MRIQRSDDGTYQRGETDRFTGDAWLRYAMTDDAANTMGEVHFSPRARTNWHMHPNGQFIFVLSGRGRVRRRDGEGERLSPGDVVHADPGEWHMHGADHDSPLVHVVLSAGTTVWGDPVTDDEYDAGLGTPG